MIYLLIGYMWLFVHRPFEVWPSLGPFHIERVYMLISIACWAASGKTWIRCRSNFPVFLLAGVYCFGVLTSPYATFEAVEDWYKILVFYVLVITSVKTEQEFKTLIVAFVTIAALYELHSMREFFNGRHVWRMGTRRMIGVDETLNDPNSFGASVAYAMLFLYPTWTIARLRWQKLAIAAAAVLAMSCILLTGSRSAFSGLVFVASVATISSRYRVRVLLVLAVGLPILWGSLRADLQDRYMSIVDPSRGKGAAEQSAQGRTESFLYGMKSFAANPLFGAGLESYRAKMGGPTHNLYNQAMGELGSFGLAVLIGFAWAFIADFRESRRLLGGRQCMDDVFLYRVCVAALLTCLLLFILGWSSHNLSRYNWLWMGAFSGIALSFLRQRTYLEDEIDKVDISGKPCGIH